MRAPQVVADALIRIPREAEIDRSVSFHALVLASGYSCKHAGVDVLMIEDALRAHPEFIEDWLRYAEDKRSNAGWFIRRAMSGGWEVGYVEGGEFGEAVLYEICADTE
jgi:hypothetical protein